jgi:hypothetical protein
MYWYNLLLMYAVFSQSLWSTFFTHAGKGSAILYCSVKSSIVTATFWHPRLLRSKEVVDGGLWHNVKCKLAEPFSGNNLWVAQLASERGISRVARQPAVFIQSSFYALLSQKFCFLSANYSREGRPPELSRGWPLLLLMHHSLYGNDHVEATAKGRYWQPPAFITQPLPFSGLPLLLLTAVVRQHVTMTSSIKSMSAASSSISSLCPRCKTDVR